MSKTKFTAFQVEHIASLIKLELTKGERLKFAKEMAETIDYIHNLEELNTAKVKPTYQTTGLTNRFQEAKTDTRRLKPSHTFKNTKKSKNQYFQIKLLRYSK